MGIDLRDESQQLNNKGKARGLTWVEGPEKRERRKSERERRARDRREPREKRARVAGKRPLLLSKKKDDSKNKHATMR